MTAPLLPASRSPAGLRPVPSTHLTEGETKQGRFPDPSWVERAFLWICRAHTGRPQGSEAHGGKTDGTAALPTWCGGVGGGAPASPVPRLSLRPSPPHGPQSQASARAICTGGLSALEGLLLCAAGRGGAQALEGGPFRNQPFKGHVSVPPSLALRPPQHKPLQVWEAAVWQPPLSGTGPKSQGV